MNFIEKLSKATKKNKSLVCVGLDVDPAMMPKDVGIFDELAKQHNVPLELSPLIRHIFQDGMDKYGPRELSPNVIKRLEDQIDSKVLAPGFPAELFDTEPAKTKLLTKTLIAIPNNIPVHHIVQNIVKIAYMNHSGAHCFT